MKTCNGYVIIKKVKQEAGTVVIAGDEEVFAKGEVVSAKKLQEGATVVYFKDAAHPLSFEDVGDDLVVVEQDKVVALL